MLRNTLPPEAITPIITCFLRILYYGDRRVSGGNLVLSELIYLWCTPVYIMTSCSSGVDPIRRSPVGVVIFLYFYNHHWPQQLQILRIIYFFIIRCGHLQIILQLPKVPFYANFHFFLGIAFRVPFFVFHAKTWFHFYNQVYHNPVCLRSCLFTGSKFFICLAQRQIDLNEGIKAHGIFMFGPESAATKPFKIIFARCPILFFYFTAAPELPSQHRTCPKWREIICWWKWVSGEVYFLWCRLHVLNREFIRWYTTPS